MDLTVSAGGEQSLECTVSVVSNLAVLPTLEWLDPMSEIVATTDGTHLNTTLNPVKTSDAGQYICRATITIESVGVSVENQSVTNFTVQSEYTFKSLYYSRLTYSFFSVTVPTPTVVISTNHSGPFYIGTDLTLTCTVTLNPDVNSNESVTIAWIGPSNITGERYSITSVSGSGEHFTSSLTISSLAEGEDSGQYTCNVRVIGESNVLEAASSDDIFINVLGKLFECFNSIHQSIIMVF